MSSSSQALLARPGQSLADHLLSVKKNAETINTELEKFVQAPVSNAELRMLLAVIAGSHDIGKASRAFQEYIRTPVKDSGKKKAHAPLSSLYAFYAARRLLATSDRTPMLASLAAVCVYSHHAGLRSPLQTSVGLDGMTDVISEQVDSIVGADLGELDGICVSMGFPTFSNFKDVWRAELSEFRRLQETTDYQSQDLSLFYLVNRLFSELIDSDRLNAASLQIPKRNSLDFDTLVTNIRAIQDEGRPKASQDVQSLRDLVFTEVVRRADEVSLDKHVFTFTAPTGSGKTLSSFYFAGRLRQRISTARGFEPRIVYVAPYLSIIDQNLGVFRRALGDLGKRPDIIFEHSHLCEYRYGNGTIEQPIEKSVLLVEGWNSEVVVTTLVQFLGSVLGRGSELLKLHNIAGSIIILDEVQAIPAEYWSLVRKALAYLTSYYGVTVVLMSATQPLIFGKAEAEELISGQPALKCGSKSNLDMSWLKGADGRLTNMTLREFVDRIIDLLNGEASQKDVMIVLNTVNSARQVFDNLSAKVLHQIWYLSAEVIPREKIGRIDEMKRLMDTPAEHGRRPLLLVTTQLVEAGVDIDFQVVVRDLSPVDSIIQSAGRCNRNGKRAAEVSKTILVELVDVNDRSFSRMIYRNTSILKTKQILQKWDTSRSMGDLSEMFYREMRALNDDTQSLEISEGIAALRYDKLDDFNVIEERDTESVFIEADENATKLFDQYRAIQSMPNRLQARLEFLTIRSAFYSYVVNVPIRYVDPSTPLIFDFYLVPIAELGLRYDEKGFARLTASPNVI